MRTPPLKAALLAALTVGLTLAPPARAHETDQYSLPLSPPFADLGPYLDAVHTLALERVVADLNADIDRVLAKPPGPWREDRLARLHNPELLVDRVYAQFSDPFTEVLDVEHAVRTSWADRAFPGQRTAHWSLGWIYSATHFPLDPRRFTLLFQASTIKAHGVYFGTDKLSHFHHMGRMYDEAYRAQRRAGRTHEQAVASIVNQYADGCLIAETTFLGFIPSGMLSNADLAANYAGFKFYRNITEPVTLRGESLEPLVVRKGPHWRLNQHVRPDSGWFGAFISDHWNEALNPCLYSDAYLTTRTRAVLRSRAASILRFYTEADHRPMDPAYYDELAVTLSTLDGEDYGHRGSPQELMTLGNTCIPALREAAQPAAGAVVVPIGWAGVRASRPPADAAPTQARRLPPAIAATAEAGPSTPAPSRPPQSRGSAP